MGSLTLRPGDLLTLLARALSIGFISFVSSTDAIQATGFLTSSPVGLTPTEHAHLSWTHCIPFNPPALYLLRLRWRQYSIDGCSELSFSPFRPPSRLAKQWLWRSSPYAINWTSSNETPNAPGLNLQIERYGPYCLEYSQAGDGT